MMTVAEKKRSVPELRFQEFDREWKETKIGEFFEFKNGLNKEKEFFGRGTPIINFMDVYRLTTITNGSFVGRVELTPNEIDRFSVEKGDVLFTRTSETIDDIGMAAVLVEDVDGCVFSGFVLRGRPITEDLDSWFVAYSFNTEGVRREIVTKSSFTTRALTNGTLLSAVEFSFPTQKNEQQKIATFLGAADDKIEQLQKKKALQEDYKKGCMQKLFSRELRFKDDNGDDFPEWEDKRLGDYCEAISGHPVIGSEIFENETPTRLLRGVNITEGRVRHSADIDRFHGGSIAGLERFLLQCEDIVVGMDGSKVGKNVAVIGEVDDGAFLIQRVARLRASGENLLAFAYHHIFSERFHRYVDRINTSSGIPHISLKQLRDFPIETPHPSEQQKIADFLSAIDTKIQLITSQIEQVQTFKKGLLQQMFV